MNQTPYSQHYQCSIELFGNYKTGLVFQVLFDKFLCNYRTKNKYTGSFIVSYVQIEKATGIGRHTVSNAIQTLNKIGVISISENECTVHASYYMSVINLYCSADKYSKKQIRSLFTDNDIEALRKLGLDETISVDEKIKDLSKGDINLPGVAQNYQGWNKNARCGTKLPSVAQKCQAWSNSSICGSFMPGFCNDLLKNLAELPELLSQGAVFVPEEADQYLQEAAEMIEKYRKQEIGDVSEDFNALVMKIGSCIVSQYVALFYQGDGTFLPRGWHFSTNIKIKERNNKEKLAKAERSEDLYIGGEKENSDLNFEKVDLNFLEPFSKDQVQDKTFQISKKNILGSSPYSKKPYYSQEEFKSITASLNPDEKVESPVRLFFYIFWWGLWDLYCDNYRSSDYDEYGNEIENDEEINDLKMIGAALPVGEIFQLVSNTYENLAGAVDKGVYEDQYGTYQLAFTEFEDFQPQYMIDWDPCKLPDGTEGIRISIDKIRNIEAEDIQQIKAPRTKDEIKAEKRRSREMVQDIMNSQIESLTPIEEAVRRFLDKYGKFDEYWHMDSFQASYTMSIPDKKGKADQQTETYETRELPRSVFMPVVMDIVNATGITLDEFFQAIDKLDSRESIKCLGSVFSSTKVANINLKHNWKSQIIDLEAQI